MYRHVGIICGYVNTCLFCGSNILLFNTEYG